MILQKSKGDGRIVSVRTEASYPHEVPAYFNDAQRQATKMPVKKS